MSRYRFPGLRSFEEGDAAIFNGRAKEKQQLFDLIMVERVVVMFAKSGTGKTSLLRAGIVPMLADLPYQPVFIRLNHPEQALTEQVFSQLAQVFGITAKPDQTLWEYLQTLHTYSGNATPVLFFDQFEELFTLYDAPELREKLIVQLADIINETLPAAIRQRLQNNVAGLTDRQLVTLEKAPRVKVVFSIRSDQLSYLHDLSDRIPGILRNRFELKGLQREQAAEAMRNPAALADNRFECPPFAFEPEAQLDILDHLGASTAGEETGIESFQLQLVCSHLEAAMLEQHKQGKSPLRIRVETYGGRAGLERLLANFYQDTIKQIPDPVQQYHARRFIENELVRNERRVSVAEAAATGGPFPVAQDTLRQLVNKRLLRREERPGLGNYYELVHDTLLKPVLQFKQERELKEAAEKARQERDAEARKRRRVVAYASVVAVLALVAFIAFLRAWYQEQKTRFGYLYTAAQVQADKNPTLAFRLGEQAWKIEPNNLQAQGMLLHTFYGPMYAVGDSFYPTPHYRELDAAWAKPAGENRILALDPDLTRLHILNPDSSEEKVLDTGAGKPVIDAALSPDGQWLVSVHRQDSIARLWQVSSGKLFQTMPHQGPVLSAAWSFDGRFFTTNANDNTQRVWQADGKQLMRYENTATTDLVPYCAFDPDSNQVLVLGNDTTLCLYDPVSGRQIWRFTQSEGNIIQARFSQNGQYVSALAFDPRRGTTILTMLDRQGNRLYTHASDRPANAVTNAIPGDDGQSALVAVKDGTLGWLYLAQDSLQLLGTPFDQHQGAITQISVSGDGAFVASAGNDKKIKVWDRQGQLRFTLTQLEKTERIFFTADSRFLAACTANGKTRFWGLKKNAIAQLPLSGVSQVFFDPRSNHIATVDRERHWGYWDVNGTAASRPTWMTDSLTDAKPWGDDHSLLIRTPSNSYRILDLRSGQSQQLPVEQKRVLATAALSDLFAVSVHDTAAELWSLSGGKRAILHHAGRKIEQVALSPDGRYAGVCYRYRPEQTESNAIYEAWITELQTQRATLILSGETNVILDFATDGQSLHISRDDALLEWDVRKQTLRLLPGQRPDGVSPVTALTHSPDGRWIATVAEDRTVSLWSRDGNWLHTFSCGRSRTNFVRFSQDGRYLLYEYHWPSRNKQVQIILLDPIRLRAAFDRNQFYQLPGTTREILSSFVNQ